MRSSAAVFLRHPIGRVVGFIALVFAIGCSSALAQQQSSQQNAFAQLARVGCETGTILHGSVELETGYIAMLGVSAKAYAFRVLNAGPHALMIPADQCPDPLLHEQKSFSFILSHSFQNRNQVREGYHYLMNQRGELLNAVHFQEGRSHLFAFANLAVPVRRADFEAEKEIWLAKAGELTELRGERRSGE